jgi:hypothetical protein
MTPDLSRVLKHELAHSFIQQKSASHAPTWIQEGLAQWMEGKRSDVAAVGLVRMYQSNPDLGIIHFEGDWMKFSNDAAAVAYAWALANIEYIVHSGGVSDLNRLMDRLATGESTESAMKTVLRSGYADLAGNTVDYLKKTYVH